MGHPIDKSERLRSNSSSQKDPGLHNEDLDPAETQQTSPRGQCAVGPGFVGEMGADTLWHALCLAEREADETDLTCCSLSSALRKHTAALSSSGKDVTDADGALQRDCIGSSCPPTPFINGLFS